MKSHARSAFMTWLRGTSSRRQNSFVLRTPFLRTIDPKQKARRCYSKARTGTWLYASSAVRSKAAMVLGRVDLLSKQTLGASASSLKLSKSGVIQPTTGSKAEPIGTLPSFGNQVNSRKPSNESIKFGTSTREVQAFRFLSNEHVKKDSNTVTPGPAAYNIRQVAIFAPELGTAIQTYGKKTAVERMGKRTAKFAIEATNKVRTQPSYGFGTSVRFDTVKDKRTGAVPGPGAYLV